MKKISRRRKGRVWWNRRRKRPAVEAGFLHTPGMAAPFLRVGRLSEQRLRLESSFGILRGRPSVMEFCTKSGNPNKPVRYTSITHLDPIKRLFLDKIREYSTKSKAHDGLVDAGPEYEKEFSEELAKLQRLYGNGDLTAFPEFEFPEPVLDEFNPK
uniref:ATP synthase peripheral stalk subunit F6, mitochondrial n=1 Tax=Astyanax mexicanus TaxID=7994 RepID=A0A8B9KQ20_ASTMX